MRTEITDTQTPERSIVRHISRDIREKFLNFFFFPESLIFGFTLVITGEHLCTIALYFQKGRAISLFDPLAMQTFAEHVTESIRPAHRNSPLSGNSFLQGVNDVFHLSTAIRLSGQSRCTKQYT